MLYFTNSRKKYLPEYHLSIVYGSDHVVHIVAVTNITTLKSERKIAPEIASLSDF
jgi:hypothetical protein